MINNGSLWPVYELRPPEGFFRGEFQRFTGGLWLPDDGEYDLAIIGEAAEGGYPACLYINLPYQRNIVWSWLTKHWTDSEPLHPNGNPWHYQLRLGTQNWGGDWGRHHHPNTVAGEAGMRKTAHLHGCANGIHAEWQGGNRIIEAGLVRIRETKEIVASPVEPMCMYCDLVWKDSKA